ncbi:uncharacterized protein RJT20DRAFT_144067 [Scheffersomyces xylosifermentans]|uniref:uncharacterized protein n=1 Tax=Scheffersomyces xylosifermentans TaxID=1304137 RepID=UPI00315CFAF9
MSGVDTDSPRVENPQDIPALTGNSARDEKPSFNYDLDLFLLTKQYLEAKNHHGLALIARQKGVPPFLRFKVWPILLKYHPYVLNPFIQPDNDIHEKEDDHENNDKNNDNEHINENNSINTYDNSEEEIGAKIDKDLKKYIRRPRQTSDAELASIESEIFSILRSSILKFTMKWGKIIKYDPSLTWIAFNLAEWFPPISKTGWVLRGRETISQDNSMVIDLMEDYSHYIDNIPDLKKYITDLVTEDRISSMSFHDVYERLVLVLLHSPEQKKRKSLNGSSSFVPPKQINKTVLPINGGTIEERVSFFIYCLRKVLPELSQFFHEEQILSKFGSSYDEWLIWWLKFGGAKVWSKYDRGRIWDRLFGWRIKNPKKNMQYYQEKLDNISKNSLSKLGPDIFWSLSNDDNYGSNNSKHNDMRRNSFKDLVEELNNDFHVSKIDTTTSKDVSSASSRRPSSSSSASTVSANSGVPSSTTSSSSTISVTIPFSKLDAHIELVFISLALLKSKENVLVELDQHEIRQFLSRLPSKSYKYKQKNHLPKSGDRGTFSNGGSTASSASSSTSASPKTGAVSPSLTAANDNAGNNNIIISNDSHFNHKVDFMDNIINESGELWRKWLWSEMIEDI